MENRKKSGCLIAVLIILALILIFAAVIKWQTSWAKTEILTSTSEDGSASLTVYMLGEPGWPFGPAKCRFDLFVNGKRQLKHQFNVFNDGAPPWEGGFDIVWRPDSVHVTVSASEQSDRVYVLNFDGTVE